MKKTALLLTLAILFTTGCATEQTKVTNVDMETAKAAAAAEAGFALEDVTVTKIELDKKNGQEYYEVDFLADGVEYDAEVDALTGKVLEWHVDEDGNKQNTGNGSGNAGSEAVNTANATETAQSGDKIGEEKAKEIALNHAGIAADQVTFVKSGIDREDGRQVYDVEFYTADKMEYDYDIDAVTGEIISYDHDAEYYSGKGDGQSQNSDTKISEAKAKEIALAQVPGAAESDIREFETDYDDGRLEYEGKIYYEHMEYEFEIDGYSGAIRSWEVEPIND